MSLRTLISILILAVLATATWLFLRDTPTTPEELPPTEPVSIPDLAQAPLDYRAQASGTISISGASSDDDPTSIETVETTGYLRMHYLVYPDNTVVIRDFNVWMGDADLQINFLFWEVTTERLRCTVFYSDAALTGRLENNAIVVPAGTKVLGHRFDQRGADGTCGGERRNLDVESPADMSITHDPGTDTFGINTTFTVEFENTDVTVTLDAGGDFINRPPIASMDLSGDGVQLLDDGCPVGVANTDQGLQMNLRSDSYDLDGNFPANSDIKHSRIDLNFEQWARSTSEGMRFLGAGQDVGTELFAIHEDHQLILWVTDRQHAEARMICKFNVKEPS